MARPSSPLLDRDVIGRAALELIDQHGDFTLSGLAERLGVHSSSVYHHVAGKSEILELVRGEVVADFTDLRFDDVPWDVALARWARAFRAAFARHPRAIRMLATAPVRKPETVDVYEHVVSAMRAAGFAAPDVLALVVALESFLLGSALDLVAPEQMIEFDSERHPVLRECTGAAPRRPRRADQAFEAGLAAIIDGFRSRLGPADVG